MLTNTWLHGTASLCYRGFRGHVVLALRLMYLKRASEAVKNQIGSDLSLCVDAAIDTTRLWTLNIITLFTYRPNTKSTSCTLQHLSETQLISIQQPIHDCFRHLIRFGLPEPLVTNEECFSDVVTWSRRWKSLVCRFIALSWRVGNIVSTSQEYKCLARSGCHSDCCFQMWLLQILPKNSRLDIVSREEIWFMIVQSHL